MPLAARIARVVVERRSTEDLPTWVHEAMRDLLREKPLTRAEILILTMARQEGTSFEELLRRDQRRA